MIKQFNRIDALYSLSTENYQFLEMEGDIISIDKDIDDGIVGGNYVSNTDTPFNQEEIQAEVARLQAEYDNAQYARDRAVAYPSIEDQLDKIYHDGIDAWKADIKAVKDEYPKP